MANEIEIRVRVRDDAAAGLAAIREEVKAEGAATAVEAEKAGDQIGEGLTNGLTRDSSGRLRNAMGRFASDLEKEAAGLGDSGKGFKVPVEPDTGHFEAEFRAAMDEAERVSERASADLRQSFGSMESGSRSLRAAMDELEPSARRGGSGLDDLGTKTANAGNSAGAAGGGFRLGTVGLSLLATAAVAAAPALAAIPAVAGAAGLGVAAMGLAFGGVIKALHDYAAEQNSSAQSGASAAATAFSNAVAIRNGEQAIADAKQRAAQTAVTSARQISDAQQALGDAERQAQTAAEASADAVAAADQRLTVAQQTLTQAQQALTQAQRDAVNVLKDLNLSAEGAANSVVDAQLAVQQAQENYDRAKGNSLLTDLQKKQALQALVDAQFHLKDAQQKAAEAQQAADDANKKGVDGSTAVVAAKQQVASAEQGVADAQHAQMRAQEAQTNQAINSAESIAKAQRAVADAVTNGAQQQAQAEQQVARAEQALADTRQQQALAAGAAGAANNKFAQDLAGLTQPGKDFVNQVLGMKNGLHELSATAQTATLPGFTQMLRDSQGMVPILNQGIKDMGGAVGGAAIKFGDLMKSPAFQGDMQKILGQAAQFTQQVASGIVDMVGGIAKAAANAGPIVKGLSQGFADLAKTGIPAFFQGLTVNASGSGQAIQALFDLVSGLLGPLGTLAGAVSGALGPALHDLVGPISHFADVLVQSLLPAMPGFSQALDSVARILGAILVIAEPLIPLITQDLTNALIILNPILSELAKLLENNHGWLGQVGKAIFELTNPVQVGMQALGWLENHFDSLKATIANWISDVKRWWDEAGKWLSDKWHTIGQDASKAWSIVYDVTVKPVSDAIGWITGPHGFSAISAFFGRLPGDFEKAGGQLFAWIPRLFKDAVNLVILAWDSLKFTTPKIHIPGAPSWMDIDSFTIGVPPIATLKALGGVGSGLTGIHDQGVELVNLPDGSVVMPHANTMSAMQNGAASGPLAIQLEWIGDHAGDAFFSWLRENIRIRGGNSTNSVQTVLGQGF